MTYRGGIIASFHLHHQFRGFWVSHLSWLSIVSRTRDANTSSIPGTRFRKPAIAAPKAASTDLPEDVLGQLQRERTCCRSDGDNLVIFSGSQLGFRTPTPALTRFWGGQVDLTGGEMESTARALVKSGSDAGESAIDLPPLEQKTDLPVGTTRS